MDEDTYHHIILGVQNKKKWGAMGISRLPKLMYKPIKFNSLYDLINEFVCSYDSYHQSILKVDLGLPFSHDRISESPLQWKLVQLKIDEKKTLKRFKEVFSQYSRDCVLIFEFLEYSGCLPKWCTKSYREGSISSSKRRR